MCVCVCACVCVCVCVLVGGQCINLTMLRLNCFNELTIYSHSYTYLKEETSW